MYNNEFDFSMDIQAESDDEGSLGDRELSPPQSLELLQNQKAEKPPAEDSKFHSEPMGQFLDTHIPKLPEDTQPRADNIPVNNAANNPDALVTKPYLNVMSPQFEKECKPIIPSKYNGLEDFMINATAKDLKTFLEAIANRQEVANALHRLRIIMGITDYDTKTEYGIYYILSYCTIEEYTNDTENFLTQSMSCLMSELFIDPYYLLECDIQIDLVALPTNLTPFEQLWVCCHKVGGIRMKTNQQSKPNGDKSKSGNENAYLLREMSIMRRLEAYLLGDRLPETCTSDKGVIQQWNLMRDWILSSPQIKNLPDLSDHNIRFKGLKKEDFKLKFLKVLETIEAELGPALDDRDSAERHVLKALQYLD